MRLRVIVGLVFVLWTALLGVLLAGGNGGLDLYVVLLLIGLLVLRELVSAHATRDLTGRMGVFIFAGLVAFAWIVVARVREILNV